MKRQDVRDAIAEMVDSAALFDNPSFDNSIIGITTDGKVVYDLHKMIDEMSVDESISSEDAADFISFNTIRMLPYISEEQRPVIVDAIDLL